MSEQTDSFDAIVAGLEYSESSGIREFETLPEEAILMLQGAVLDYAQPYTLEDEEDELQASMIFGLLEKRMAELLERTKVFSIGDTLRFLRNGTVITISPHTGYNKEFLGQGVSVSGTVSKLGVTVVEADPTIIDPAPDLSSEEDGVDDIGEFTVSVGAVLTDARIEIKDSVMNTMTEVPFTKEIDVFVPFCYLNLMVQREITDKAGETK